MFDQVIDRFGRRIVLTEERWNHITVRHPELLNSKSKVLRSLSNPEIIIENTFNTNVNLYHRFDKKLGGYIVTIVEIKKNFIITSYVSLKVKTGKIIWEKNLASPTTKREIS